jgi:hypothetical protein
MLVCRVCEKRAVDSDGRPISIEERISRQGEIVFLGGPAAFFKEPGPQSGQLCEEVTESNICWVDGKEVHLFEGIAGWIGLIDPQSA